MSARRDAALATLRRLGLDLDAATDDPPEDRIDALIDGPEPAAVVEALGEVGGAAAARALARRASDETGGPLRKAFRRALFRLQQRGVPVPASEEAPATAVSMGGPDIDGLVSAFDGNGDRLIWLVRPRSGGTQLLAAEVNEPGGLRDVRLVEVSRKELRALRERFQKDAGLRLVPADWRVLDALLVEAHERAGAPDRARDYLRLRPELTTAPPLAPAELRSALAAPPTDDERPALLGRTDELLTLPELRSWGPRPETAAPYVEEIASVRDSPLVLNRMQQEERLQAILVRAASALYPPPAVARRLEGTAYVLAETGRVPAARQLLAAAQALRAGTGADEVPLVRALVQQGIGALFAAERSRREEARSGSLVVTPGEALTDPASSRRARTRG